jgi:hypothetical protein
MDVKEIGGEMADCTDMTQDMDKWQVVLDVAMNI